VREDTTRPGRVLPPGGGGGSSPGRWACKVRELPPVCESCEAGAAQRRTQRRTLVHGADREREAEI